MQDAEERFEVAQVAAVKAGDDAQIAKAKASKSEVDYVAKVVLRRDEVGELTRQLRQQAPLYAAVSRELAAVQTELKGHKAKAPFLEQTLKVTREEVAAIKSAVEK